MTKIVLGLSGDIGSFSEEAALLYARKKQIKPTLSYLIDMEGVLAAVEKKEVDLGIFPVINTRGGLVKMAFEAMGKHLFTPIDELCLNVQQCLLVRPGTTKEQVRLIVSHPQALAQCQNYLQAEFKNAKLVEWIDTAKAARDLSENKLTQDTAVIASELSAQVYGLKVLAKGIQDITPNVTTFILVKPYAKSEIT
jgi:prephenate dehydratase